MRVDLSHRRVVQCSPCALIHCRIWLVVCVSNRLTEGGGGGGGNRNHDGFPAKFGLSGEMDPQCTPYRLNKLRKADSTERLLSAFGGLEGRTDVDKAKLVQTAMDKKKDLKVRALTC